LVNISITYLISILFDTVYVKVGYLLLFSGQFKVGVCYVYVKVMLISEYMTFMVNIHGFLHHERIDSRLFGTCEELD
jgi:hypothetical protein